jgi:hypothetical protein
MLSVPFFSSGIFGDVDFEMSYIIDIQPFRKIKHRGRAWTGQYGQKDS